MRIIVLFLMFLIVGCLLLAIALTYVNLSLIRNASLRDVPKLVFEYAVWLITLVLLVLLLALMVTVILELTFKRLLS